MTTETTKRVGSKGDWLEVRGLPGRPTRRGQIVDVIGRRLRVDP